MFCVWLNIEIIAPRIIVCFIHLSFPSPDMNMSSGRHKEKSGAAEFVGGWLVECYKTAQLFNIIWYEKKRSKKIIQRGIKREFIINIPFMSLIILIFSKALSVL